MGLVVTLPVAARRLVRGGLLLGAVVFALQWVTVVPAVRSRAGAGWAGELLQDMVYALAAGLVLARGVLVRKNRRAWLLMGSAVAVYAAGTIYWAAMVRLGPSVPFPSLSDAGWLLYYPFAYAAVLRLLRGRLPRIGIGGWLDALIASACGAAFASMMLLEALATVRGLAPFPLAVTFSYPIADIVLAGGLLGAWALSGWRTERLWMSLLAGMAVITFANGVYVLRSIHGTYVGGTWFDLLWSVGFACIVAAAWLDGDGPRLAGRRPAQTWVAVALPAVLACASVALLLYGSWKYAGPPRVSAVLAAAAITGAVIRMVLTVRTAGALSDALRRLARTDDMTELPNRRLFLEHLDDLLHHRDPGRPLAVAIVDLDRFKEINDSFGHHVGDRLLQLVGARLAGSVGAAGVVARLGGDEFGLILPTAAAGRARELIAATLTALRRPYPLEPTALHVDASIGIAVFPDHGTDRATLLRQSDTAMYTAKNAQAGYAVATEDADAAAGRRRLTTLEELRAGLDRGELTLHYQPQIDVASGRVAGVEALVRWNHPSRGLLYPDSFLPIAEQAGLMDRITQQVLELALQQCRTWRVQGLDLSVAVNLSASNLQDPGLPTLISEALTRHQLPAEVLHLEITEEVVMRDAPRAIAVLTGLRSLGMRLAVDDYGTGYSSLAYLHALPVNDLKLDRAFVTHCDTDPRSAAIVESTVDLAHNLGMRMIAEGVENEPIVQRLLHWGCDLAQGYHLSRPQDANLLTPWLIERRSSTVSSNQGLVLAT